MRCPEHAGNILGLDIKGHIVKTVWVEFASDIAEEYYASFTLDRSAKKHLGMLSARAAWRSSRGRDRPRRHRQDLHIDPVDGLTEEAARAWVEAAKLNPAATDGAVDILLKLYRAYTEGDADLCRDQPAHPQAHRRGARPRRQGHLDGNAQFRHEAGRSSRPPRSVDEREQAAHDKDLQYVGLDGTVGVIANGAGLAMSTVDIVNQVGGKPANFLDIGGGANAEVMAGALEVINNDENVKSIFINIFGGITKGDEVANGIVTALGRVKIDAPIVIRLDGTNADRGPRDPRRPRVGQLQSKPTMLEAARTAVELAK
jgi:succinyl-CoA synthetase beta subunit